MKRSIIILQGTCLQSLSAPQLSMSALGCLATPNGAEIIVPNFQLDYRTQLYRFKNYSTQLCCKDVSFENSPIPAAHHSSLHLSSAALSALVRLAYQSEVL